MIWAERASERSLARFLGAHWGGIRASHLSRRSLGQGRKRLLSGPSPLTDHR